MTRRASDDHHPRQGVEWGPLFRQHTLWGPKVLLHIGAGPSSEGCPCGNQSGFQAPPATWTCDCGIVHIWRTIKGQFGKDDEGSAEGLGAHQ